MLATDVVTDLTDGLLWGDRFPVALSRRVRTPHQHRDLGNKRERAIALEKIARYYPGAKIETLEMAQVFRETAPKKEQKVTQFTEVISQSAANGDKAGRNSVAKQLLWSAGQVCKLAGYLGEKRGISVGWGELIEALTSVLKNLNTKVTGHRHLTPVELRTVEVFFRALVDDLRRNAISTEASAVRVGDGEGVGEVVGAIAVGGG